jgi:hypothetical protein
VGGLRGDRYLSTCLTGEFSDTASPTTTATTTTTTTTALDGDIVYGRARGNRGGRHGAGDGEIGKGGPGMCSGGGGEKSEKGG